MTKAPRARSIRPRTTMPRKAVTATNATADENSYMLPQGTRWAANPRSTIETRCTAQPRQVSRKAARPARDGAFTVTVSAGTVTGGPAPTSTDEAARTDVTRRRAPDV